MVAGRGAALWISASQSEEAAVKCISALLAIGLMVSTGWAKDKTKNILPAYSAEFRG